MRNIDGWEEQGKLRFHGYGVQKAYVKIGKNGVATNKNFVATGKKK